MVANDFLGDRQAKPGAIFLGGEKRVEQPAPRAGRDARPVIADLDGSMTLGAVVALAGIGAANSGRKTDATLLGQDIGGVVDQVDENLQHLLFINPDTWFFVETPGDLDSFTLEPWLGEHDRLLDQLGG